MAGTAVWTDLVKKHDGRFDRSGDAIQGDNNFHHRMGSSNTALAVTQIGLVAETLRLRYPQR